MVQSLPAPAVPAESSSQLDFPRPPWHCKHWECSWAHLGRRQGWFYPVALGPFAADLKQEHVTNQEAKKTLDASRSSSLKQGCYQTKLAWWGFNIMHCRYREQHFRRNTYITDLWIKPERGGGQYYIAWIISAWLGMLNLPWAMLHWRKTNHVSENAVYFKSTVWSSYGDGSKLGTPKLWMVNTKLD